MNLLCHTYEIRKAYILCFLYLLLHMEGKVMVHSQFIKTVVSALDLSKTDAEILKALIVRKGGLLISEITNYIHRSERNVRNRLDLLIQKGILKKEIEVLNNKRLAHRYSLESVEKIVETAKNHLLKKVGELNNLLHFND